VILTSEAPSVRVRVRTTSTYPNPSHQVNAWIEATVVRADPAQGEMEAFVRVSEGSGAQTVSWPTALPAQVTIGTAAQCSTSPCESHFSFGADATGFTSVELRWRVIAKIAGNGRDDAPPEASIIAELE
jgi:hypothetical protein